VPIATTDLLLKLSITTGTAGNAAAQPNPNASLGKYISTTQIVDNTLNNLFDDITGDENAAGTVDYRCIFIHNAHATLTLLAPVVWLSAEVAGGANTAIAVDNIAASAVGATAAQAAVIANETTAPTGVGAFSSPTTKGTGLVLGDLPPGQCRAIWVRRTATNSAAVNNDGATIRVEGDTIA
jgi:hypothetical protein